FCLDLYLISGLLHGHCLLHVSRQAKATTALHHPCSIEGRLGCRPSEISKDNDESESQAYFARNCFSPFETLTLHRLRRLRRPSESTLSNLPNRCLLWMTTNQSRRLSE